MTKLISQNALVLRRQYKLKNYWLTHYASQNFHNALTVTFESGQEFLVVLKQDENIEIFQDIDFFGGDSPTIKLTLSSGPLSFSIKDNRNLNESFELKEIESYCHILQYDEEKLPEKKWRTRTHTRKDHFKDKKDEVKK